MSSAESFRLALVALIATLLAVLGNALWRYGRTPTDENLFTGPPSAVMLAADVNGRPQPLRAGNLVVSVDGADTVDTVEYQAAVLAARGDARVAIVRGNVVTPEVTVDADALRQAPVRDVSHTALVVNVTPDGASARAGMQVGILIVRINDQPFTDIFQADAILRSGTVGRSTDYDVLRRNEPLTLRLTLASFGLRLSIVTFSMVGLAFVAFGGFLGLARPRIPAARLLALAFTLMGAAISLTFLQRRFDTDVIARVRELAGTASFFLGIAAFTHAALYFPRERSSMLAARWVVPGAYALALASVVITATARSNRTTVVLIGLNLLYMSWVRWRSRRDLPADARRIRGSSAGPPALPSASS